MLLPGVRGVLLEELVLYLLSLVGYRIVSPGEEGTKLGHSGLEVRGRGAWHQIDALAAFDRTPAFMYPLRLMVEAKCYARGNRVGIEVARNAVGVLKDISENYFTYPSPSGGGSEIQVPRFNYHSAIFSTSGYSSGTQRYAIAHQVFLIQYQRIHLLQPIIDALLDLDQHYLRKTTLRSSERQVSAKLRSEIRHMIEVRGDAQWAGDSVFTKKGHDHIRENIVIPLLCRVSGQCTCYHRRLCLPWFSQNKMRFFAAFMDVIPIDGHFPL